MGYIYSRQQLEEYILQRPYQQDEWVPKECMVHPQALGIPYTCLAYRFPTQDGRAIDIKENGDYWRVHWEWYDPSTHPIEHGVCDAPWEWLLTTAGIGAVISPKGRKGEGALKGVAWGLGLALLLKAMLSKN